MDLSGSDGVGKKMSQCNRRRVEMKMKFTVQGVKAVEEQHYKVN